MNLRELFINWLTASRFIRSLEQRLVEQRQDYTERLGEKDELIRLLRTEIASLKLECDRMRAITIPQLGYAQREPKPVPAFTGPDDWQAELNRIYDQEEKDGIQKQRREVVHQSAADDGA